MFVFFLSPNSGRAFETLFTLRFPLAGRGERSPEIRPHELIYKNTHAVTTVHHFPTRRSAGRFPALGEGEGGGGRGGGGGAEHEKGGGDPELRSALPYHHPGSPFPTHTPTSNETGGLSSFFPQTAIARR